MSDDRSRSRSPSPGSSCSDDEHERQRQSPRREAEEDGFAERERYDDEDDQGAQRRQQMTTTTGEKMMSCLEREEQRGMFRALRPRYATEARHYHRLAAERANRVPSNPCPSFFSDGRARVLRLRNARGPVLARGYAWTIDDEHGYYYAFRMSQLNRADVSLERQPRGNQLSAEYRWTHFRCAGVDVYYAGDDPFAPERQQQQQPSAPEPVAAPAPAPALPAGQRTLTSFFSASAGAVTAPESAPCQERKRVAGRKKHSAFTRGMFYVRVLDVVAVDR